MDIEANRAQQVELYGAPLGDILTHCAAALGLSQAGLAEALGISAPMLSQLINGRRIKIANPAAAERMRALVQLVEEVDAGRLSADDALTSLAKPSAPHLINQATRTRSVAGHVQEIFRATASASDYLEAAATLRTTQPQIAEMLRVYGTERADFAEEYTRQIGLR